MSGPAKLVRITNSNPGNGLETTTQNNLSNNSTRRVKNKIAEIMAFILGK
jgi:hypothetical protein